MKEKLANKREVVIQASNVFKTYHEGESNEVKALNDVSFEVEKGEIVVVMGESGSGKTTLLNCISGIDDVTGGIVNVNGEDLAKMKDRKKTKYRAEHMGFVFQTFNLIPVLTAQENVELPLLISGTKPSVARKKANEILDHVGLADRLTHKPSELSGGQRQRVTIARALANDPAVVWADEPTGNLDSETAAEVMELLMEMNKTKGSTIVMVTHSESIAKYAQRKVIMANGKIVD